MDNKEFYTFKLSMALDSVQRTLTEIKDFASSKQSQRAESWQQTLIDKIERSQSMVNGILNKDQE